MTPGAPKAPPAQAAPPPAAKSPKQQLDLPSILLLCLAGAGALSGLLGLVTGGGISPEMLDQLKALGASNPDAQGLIDTYVKLLQALSAAARPMNAFALLLDGLIVAGALQMRSLRSYPLAMAGAVASLMPLSGCCCCLTLPVGIWSLVLLMRPDVRAAFGAPR